MTVVSFLLDWDGWMGVTPNFYFPFPGADMHKPHGHYGYRICTELVFLNLGNLQFTWKLIEENSKSIIENKM